ncbi:MAG: DNA polymerase III subunit gamma/tau, partial [Sphingopyxis sp.]|nr:DNA polymerase III subunit gamma/tau [Sphingopyxis sp.]
LSATVPRDLGDALLAATGSRWNVRAGEGDARPSLGEMRAATAADNEARIRELPVVKAALAAFPDASLEDPADNRHKSNP